MSDRAGPRREFGAALEGPERPRRGAPPIPYNRRVPDYPKLDSAVETHGEAQLVELITAFGEGQGLDGAFETATGEDFAAFDAAWLASLGADPPEPYGPQEGEPGPVPEAWARAADALLR